MKPGRRAFLGAAVALWLAAGIGAADSSPASGALEVEGAWARATAPGAAVGAVYMVIRNPGQRSDRLLSATTSRAARVEFHATIRDADRVRMQRVDPVHVAARADLKLEPGGLHAMLFGLKTPLRRDESLPLTLVFERAGRVQVEVRVLDDQPGPARHTGH